MKTSILSKEHFQESVWSGGTTRQLYISPTDSSYAERRFDVRLSTARVEVEKSSFTSLPGVNRKLMILEGEITVHHQDQYSKQLKAFDVDSFKGEWLTTSVGNCTDFNVMTKGNIQSDLSSLQLDADSPVSMEIDNQWSSVFVYVFSGELKLMLDEKSYSLNKENLLMINEINGLSLLLETNKICQVVLVKIDINL